MDKEGRGNVAAAATHGPMSRGRFLRPEDLRKNHGGKYYLEASAKL